VGLGLGYWNFVQKEGFYEGRIIHHDYPYGVDFVQFRSLKETSCGLSWKQLSQKLHGNKQ